MKIKKKSVINEDISFTIMDSNKPLSQSLIWKLQSDFYANQGPSAWIKGIVPQYVTTNPYIADIYAKVAFAYLRDYTTSHPTEKTIYIMELAAGVGRFTFSFLKRFQRLMERSTMKDIKVKYIITDFAEQNIEFWLNHSYLQPYFQSGLLDCATFDMTKDDEIILRKSGKRLKKGHVDSPVILFANYAFDTLPQDSFYVKENRLYEGQITISQSNETPNESNSSSILSNLSYSYEDVLIDDINYYEEDEFNSILKYYTEYLNDSAFSIPIASLRCLNRIQNIFEEDMVLLASDKGYNSLASIEGINHPYLSQHGSISLTVNLHAIELYFAQLGGNTVHSSYKQEHVTTSLFMKNDSYSIMTETELAFYEYVDSIGADEFHSLKQGIVKTHREYSTRQLLTLLRYTLWDSRTFIEFYQTFLERIQTEEDFPIEDFVSSIFSIWDNYFPIGEETNLAYCFGTLLAYFGYDYDAIQFFETSIQFYGEDAGVYYEIALCYVNLEIFEKALESIDKSLAMEKDYEESLHLKSILLSNYEA